MPRSFVCLLLLLSVSAASPALAQHAFSDVEIVPGVGAKPYHEPEHGPLRVSGSVGYNVGNADLPLAVSEIASYSFGLTEVAVAALEASGSGGVPRKSLAEFDLLAGIGVEPEILSPDRSAERFHISALTGLAFVSYQERYRRRFRGAPIDTTLPPNVAAYALGIPLRVRATYEPFRFAAVGFEVFATVSRLRPTYGAGLTLQVGWF